VFADKFAVYDFLSNVTVAGHQAVVCFKPVRIFRVASLETFLRQRMPVLRGGLLRRGWLRRATPNARPSTGRSWNANFILTMMPVYKVSEPPIFLGIL
jgi:hypothetical protein